MIRAIAVLLGGLLVVSFASEAQPRSAGKLRIQLESPELLVLGEEFVATVELRAAGGDVEIEGWQLTPSALAMDDVPMGRREDGAKVLLASGDSIELRFELSKRVDTAFDFELSYAGSDANPIEVSVHKPAPEDIDFMTLPEEELKKYRVYMHTNRGDMLHEMWPHLAPNHVRNFLDLTHTSFYDGTTFHRVMSGFMIQGGDPMGNGGGTGPRTLEPEFSKELHLRGVLSMARGDDPASGSCQFFVMHAAVPGLDNNYSIFGKLLIGYSTLDAIVTAPGRMNPNDGTIRPNESQIIERAVVVLAK